jgi:hypothetical protein
MPPDWVRECRNHIRRPHFLLHPGRPVRLLLRPMTRQRQKFRHFILLLLISVVLTGSRAKAQQPSPPPPAPSPAPQANAPQDQKSDAAAQDPDAAKKQDETKKPDDTKKPDEEKKPDANVGKSKLEKDTGTVNDRIFEVLPNYGTVETSKTLPPLTTGQKYRIATASVFDWAAFPFNGVLAAIAQAKNDPKSYGQGWGAYGKRYGESFADNSIGTYMTVAIFPSMLHEDPRYYQLSKGTFSHRAWYAMSRLWITRTDSGGSRFNYSEFVGNAAAAAISNIYHPEEDRTASRNASTLGFLILYDGLANELKEFWPDIRRKLHHKKNP